MVAEWILLGLLAVASATDVTRHKIYNWTTYPGIVVGLLWNAFATDGMGWQESVAGFLGCGTVMLFCFVLFNMGGGDVKLVAMMGAFLGLERGIEAMLWTFVLGAILGVAILIWQFGIGRMMRKSAQHLLLIVRTRTWVPLTPAERQPLQRWLYLAPAALFAVCIIAFRPRIFM